ncbi:acylneuraminate cytidylyltransferase family protein, partial [Klebsiella pneumoniae]|nr:acylneuraminate cytidylyltransferase family protein [Klebsiella pneumoniae]
MKINAFIFARGGSKGLPGKNIKPLAGKPLLQYSIETAKQSPSISSIYVSTDDDDIAL